MSNKSRKAKIKKDLKFCKRISEAVEQGRNVMKTQRTLFEECVQTNNLKGVKLLLEQEFFDVNQQFDDMPLVLYVLAVAKKKGWNPVPMLEVILLTREEIDLFVGRPLRYMISEWPWSPSPEVIKLLLAHFKKTGTLQAQLDHQPNDEGTVLFVCPRSRFIFDLFIEAGANPDIRRRSDNRTELENEVLRGNEDRNRWRLYWVVKIMKLTTLTHCVGISPEQGFYSDMLWKTIRAVLLLCVKFVPRLGKQGKLKLLPVDLIRRLINTVDFPCRLNGC